MRVQRASDSDRDAVLGFCRNTFSWGDYIGRVWDDWILRGDLLIVCDGGAPVAVCHARHFACQQGMWIEGIRVHPSHRRRGHASRLVRHCEGIARAKGCTNVQMFIETDNLHSIALARTAGYRIVEKWGFYSLECARKNAGAGQDAGKNAAEFLASLGGGYVDSWHWRALTKDAIDALVQGNNVIISRADDGAMGAAVFAESENFGRTVLVSVLAGDCHRISDMLSSVQYMAQKRGMRRIQIVTRMESMPPLAGLEKKLSFYLVEKRPHAMSSLQSS